MEHGRAQLQTSSRISRNRRSRRRRSRIRARMRSSFRSTTQALTCVCAHRSKCDPNLADCGQLGHGTCAGRLWGSWLQGRPGLEKWAWIPKWGGAPSLAGIGLRGQADVGEGIGICGGEGLAWRLAGPHLHHRLRRLHLEESVSADGLELLSPKTWEAVLESERQVKHGGS